MSSSWGGGGYGVTPWGGGFSSAVSMVLLSAVAIAENVVQLTFSEKPYWSGLLDANDASESMHYVVEVVPGTFGLDGSPVREVRVLFAQLDPTNANRINVYLDRPMTPIPAEYQIVVAGLVDANTHTAMATATFGFQALYRRIVPPQADSVGTTRDLASPMTGQALLDPTPDPTNANFLGTFITDEQGDYGFDEGDTSLKKRIFRRWFTRKNGYAHLPGYGIGITQYGKRLAKAGVRALIAADAQNQIQQEPEVATAQVTSIVPFATPMLCRFVNAIQTKTGRSVNLAVTVPFFG